jgi:hypothetical protein
MKKIFSIIALLFFCVNAFAAVDRVINPNPPLESELYEPLPDLGVFIGTMAVVIMLGLGVYGGVIILFYLVYKVIGA